MIPLAIPDLRGNESAYLQECVRDNWVSTAGPHVVRFEEEIAKLCQGGYSVAVVNGTCALQLAVRVVCDLHWSKTEIESRPFVILPDWTFAATANAVIHAGFQPYFVDIDLVSWTMSPKALQQVLVDRAEKIAAIMPVNVMGLAPDLAAILQISADFDIPVVEDSACAIGATYQGKTAGTHGLAGAFSFNGNKTVTAGGGGMVVTKSKTVSERVRLLSTQARTHKRYQHSDVGYNYRMTNLNAAVGLAQLERLPEMLATKRVIADRYQSAAIEHPKLSPQPSGPGHSWWMSVVRVSSASEGNSLSDHLRANGIDARVFWESLSSQAPYKAFSKNPTPNADQLSGSVVALPCSSSLTPKEQTFVLETLRSWR